MAPTSGLESSCWKVSMTNLFLFLHNRDAGATPKTMCYAILLPLALQLGLQMRVAVGVTRVVLPVHVWELVDFERHDIQ